MIQDENQRIGHLRALHLRTQIRKARESGGLLYAVVEFERSLYSLADGTLELLPTHRGEQRGFDLACSPLGIEELL